MSKSFNKLDFLNNCHDKKPIVIKNYFDVSRLSWNKINPTLNTFKRDCNKPPKTRRICTQAHWQWHHHHGVSGWVFTNGHMDTNSQIHQYFKQHWQAWFPNLGLYPNFAKQYVNLLQVKTFIQQHIIKQHGQDNIHFIRARDLWHLSHRFMRKILAYNFCFVINKQLGNPPF